MGLIIFQYIDQCICVPFRLLESGDPYHGGYGFHQYRLHDHAMVWIILNVGYRAAGCFLYDSFVRKVKTMSFERVGESARAITNLPVKPLIHKV